MPAVRVWLISGRSVLIAFLRLKSASFLSPDNSIKRYFFTKYEADTASAISACKVNENLEFPSTYSLKIVKEPKKLSNGVLQARWLGGVFLYKIRGHRNINKNLYI